MKCKLYIAIFAALGLVFISVPVNTARANECANETARAFGEKIQHAVSSKDKSLLMSLFPKGELKSGPRRAYLKDKTFDEVFSEEWRQAILEDKAPCTPVGWRGFLLGHGRIWYTDSDFESGNAAIISIGGAMPEISEEKTKDKWLYKGQALKPACFTTLWASSDNYQHFHETYVPDTDFDEFYRYVGRYIGSDVPLGNVKSPWDGRDKIALAKSIADCQRPSEDEEYRERREYKILKEISATHCASLAPALSDNCRAVILATVSQDGGSMVSVNTVLYAIIEESNSSYVVPLVNFDNEGDALNFIDSLKL